MHVFLGIRAFIFYAGFTLSVIFISLTGIVLLSYTSYRLRSKYMVQWNRFIMFWLRVTCGVKVDIIGRENLPEEAFVALSKHQSQWETYFLQYFLWPVSIVLKRELLKMPFFGWGLKLTDPIAIDRGSPKLALKQTLQQGKDRLLKGVSVLIFPEGTRTEPGTKSKYARGGANIAIAAGAPIVPIALNAGEFWPADKYLKFPGTITVKIGKPIATNEGSDSRVITEQAQQWIEEEVEKMSKRLV